jgi:hypothetical protein
MSDGSHNESSSLDRRVSDLDLNTSGSTSKLSIASQIYSPQAPKAKYVPPQLRNRASAPALPVGEIIICYEDRAYVR